MPITNDVTWEPTDLPCPYLCGYVFDKGFQQIDEGRPASRGLTVCSRCKRALVWGNGAVEPFDEAELSTFDRAQLENLRDIIRQAEKLRGGGY